MSPRQHAGLAGTFRSGTKPNKNKVMLMELTMLVLSEKYVNQTLNCLLLLLGPCFSAHGADWLIISPPTVLI